MFNNYDLFILKLGSTYLESELTDIGEYRRRTLSRCNSSFNYTNALQQQKLNQLNQSPSFEMNIQNNGDLANGTMASTNLLQIPNSNYLQIPRHSRSSIRRSSLRNSQRRYSKSKLLASIDSGNSGEHFGSNGIAPPVINLNESPNENLIESCITEVEAK